MGRSTGRSSKSEPPKAHHAPWALCSLAAWRHYVGNEDAEPALAALHAKHKAERPSADVAAAEAWDVLDRCGVLAEFESWSRANGGRGGYWPTSRVDGLRAV